MNRAACQAERKTGERWCWCHHPERQAIAAAARSDGGRKDGRLRAIDGRRRKLEDAGQLARFLSELIQTTLAGQTPPDIARACMYGASVLRQVVETSELQRRLEALEAQLAAGGSRWRA